MKYDEFVGQVQDRAQLGSSGKAVGAIRATLETLANRLNLESADNLAAQLPREIGYYMVNAPRCYPDRAERFDLEEFFDRVSLMEPADLPDAVYHARVVIEVLGEAISLGERRKLLAQLPKDYEPLFFAGSEGEMRPKPAARRGNRGRSASRRVN